MYFLLLLFFIIIDEILLKNNTNSALTLKHEVLFSRKNVLTQMIRKSLWRNKSNCNMIFDQNSETEDALLIFLQI